MIAQDAARRAIQWRMRGLSTVLAVVIAACGLGCSNSQGSSPPAPHSLRYFGYALVDCGFDDPLDAVAQTNYVDEVASFTNMAQMCVFDPDERVIDRIRRMSRRDLKVLLAVQAIFFVGIPDASQGSGMKFDLHPRYQARWDAFVRNNNLLENESAIAAFYVADEPIWNGIAYPELKAAADAIKATFPSVPTAIIEAPAGIEALRVPASIDWIGFDHYAIPKPDTDPVFRKELALLKSKRSRASQRIVLVMDAQWLPFYGDAGYSDSYMASVATRYYRLAASDPEVVGIIGYLWPGGLDDPKQKGTRHLPRNVIDEHMRIGKIITGKK